MTRIKTGLAALLCFGLAITETQGQVTIDVAKITCEQFRNYSITDPSNIALWLSGYYNGQRGNTIVSVSSFKENLDKVKDYCITNPTTTVMHAVDAIFGKQN